VNVLNALPPDVFVKATTENGHHQKLAPPEQRDELRQVAEQFESLMYSEIFKTMRQTMGESSGSEGLQGNVFMGMFDEELAKQATIANGLGYADIIYQQLGGKVSSVAPNFEQQQLLQSSTWQKPVATAVTFGAPQRFGAFRPGERPEECIQGHCGVDIAEPIGTPVVASGEGYVSNIGRDENSSAGLWIEITHHQGKIVTQYMHLSAITDEVAIGSQVHGGQVIGAVGDTGTAAHGSHLHFEIHVKNHAGEMQRINPEPFLQVWQPPTNPTLHSKILPQVYSKSDDDRIE